LQRAALLPVAAALLRPPALERRSQGLRRRRRPPLRPPSPAPVPRPRRGRLARRRSRYRRRRRRLNVFELGLRELMRHRRPRLPQRPCRRPSCRPWPQLLRWRPCRRGPCRRRLLLPLLPWSPRRRRLAEALRMRWLPSPMLRSLPPAAVLHLPPEPGAMVLLASPLLGLRRQPVQWRLPWLHFDLRFYPRRLSSSGEHRPQTCSEQRPRPPRFRRCRTL